MLLKGSISGASLSAKLLSHECAVGLQNTAHDSGYFSSNSPLSLASASARESSTLVV